jgi:hypothetical protein
VKSSTLKTQHLPILVKGPSGNATRGKISKGNPLEMDDITDIMDQLNIESDSDFKKVINNGN